MVTPMIIYISKVNEGRHILPSLSVGISFTLPATTSNLLDLKKNNLL